MKLYRCFRRCCYYCKKNIDEKKFIESVVAIKGVFKEAGLPVPNEYKMTKKSSDFKDERWLIDYTCFTNSRFYLRLNDDFHNYIDSLRHKKLIKNLDSIKADPLKNTQFKIVMNKFNDVFN